MYKISLKKITSQTLLAKKLRLVMIININYPPAELYKYKKYAVKLQINSFNKHFL